jgi:hypothetical protein
LVLPAGVEIPVLQQGAEHDLPVVQIGKPKGGESGSEDAEVDA